MTDEEREILELFCKRVDEVAKSSIYKDGGREISLNLKGDAKGNVALSMSVPDKEVLLSLVTKLRQFYMPKESIYFRKVYNIVWKHLSSASEEEKECAKSAMATFKQITEVGWFEFRFNNVKLTPKDIIDIWFNGNIFHADKTRVKQFELLAASNLGPFVEYQFISTICDLAGLMTYFGSFIRARLLK
ncbi:MAG: hypothetical protein NT002_11355 [candidate division Zixibacteria bacterium]|nr:hypothetical protein [candidate division Zixibacteria bacterium]